MGGTHPIELWRASGVGPRANGRAQSAARYDPDATVAAAARRTRRGARTVPAARRAGTGRRETGLEPRWEIASESRTFAGKEIGATGIAASRAAVLLLVTLRDGRSLRAVLTPDHASFLVPERQRAIEVARSYVRLGIEHILTGIDHLLFVLGLLLLISGRRRLVWTLTAFTLGHSVTLSLAALGLVHVPTAPVEAAIAGSILVLAVELARDPASARGSWVHGRPWTMAALFGLLHGLGFAGALVEAGLPDGEIPLALFSFNVGIEIGQLAFVAAAVTLGAAVGALLPLRRGVRRLAPAYAIGSLAAFWV